MNRFDRLGEQIAREQDALLARRNTQAAVQARLADVDLDTLRPQERTPWLAVRPRSALWAGAGAFALAAVVLVLVLARPAHNDSGPISVQLVRSSTALQVGEFVQAPNDGMEALQFSDGSHIELAQGGRARVLGLRGTGADVSLESGQINVKVQHREHSSWHIGAGPFGVHVTGTRFDVRWNPDDDMFELTLHEGKVEVSGCLFGAGYHVQAGQTVHASCSKRLDVSAARGAVSATAGSASIETITPAATPTELPVVAPPSAAPAPAPTAPAPTAPSVSTRPSEPTQSSLRTRSTRPQTRAL
ncbi:MAG: FecR family protein, partial [Polyangiales bacterium]